MRKLYLSNFILKVIAIITMTIDHIGTLLCNFAFENQAMFDTGISLQWIGRLSAPLFIFLAVEGALKTHDVKKYLLKLSLICLPIILVQTILEIITQTTDLNLRFNYGNIFITLILIVLMITCFESKNKYLKPLGILPIIICVLGFIATGYEFSQAHTNLIVWWFPYMLRPQYDIFAIFLALTYYLSHKIIKGIYENYGMDPNLYKGSENYQFGTNALQCLGLLIASILLYLLKYICPQYVYWEPNIQLFAIAAIVFILFYNGKRGYNAKWFNIFAYLYYPVHLVFLYSIFLLIFI